LLGSHTFGVREVETQTIRCDQ